MSAMRYRVLGSSGMKVSQLCLGTMLFGGPTAEADARWHADIDNMKNDFNVARQNSALQHELSGYRQNAAAIADAGGDLRWRALDTQTKFSALVTTLDDPNIKIFG